jgi:hypothetical protein
MSLSALINASYYLPDGTPVVDSHTITGVIFKEGEPYPKAYIEIIEPDLHPPDVGTGYADEQGRFSIKVGEDTFHHVWVDQQDIQLVKVLTR